MTDHDRKTAVKGNLRMTANMGSIDYIPDILSGNGVFVYFGEKVFDDYWAKKGGLDAHDPKDPGK